ncbi:MAG: hypothetical protein JWM12_689 [Ilumatobacteraceae bacterium]|nr:hypothetical protein [Ilumatobacteraceae bacterium]
MVARLRAAGIVFAEDEALLLVDGARTPAELDALVQRRADGSPLEQVLGWAELCGLRIKVAPGVFVPRRRTELLVREAAAVTRRNAVVVDLCCGSGAIGVALMAAVGPVDLHAVDIDPAAVRCARDNLGDGGQVFEGDLFAPLPALLRGRVDVLVANAPYVPSAAIRTLPAEARLHEALVALDGGRDGLDVHRRVAAAASAWLAPNGHLLIETSDDQAPLAHEIFADARLEPSVVRSEELGATVVIGRNRGA